jgi:hypothetical protein
MRLQRNIRLPSRPERSRPDTRFGEREIAPSEGQVSRILATAEFDDKTQPHCSVASSASRERRHGQAVRYQVAILRRPATHREIVRSATESSPGQRGDLARVQRRERPHNCDARSEEIASRRGESAWRIGARPQQGEAEHAASPVFRLFFTGSAEGAGLTPKTGWTQRDRNCPRSLPHASARNPSLYVYNTYRVPAPLDTRSIMKPEGYDVFH